MIYSVFKVSVMHQKIINLKVFSEVLIAYRKNEKGFNQQQMADMLGMKQQNYSALEKKPSTVSFGRILEVLDKLGLTLHLADESLVPAPKTKESKSAFSIFGQVQASHKREPVRSAGRKGVAYTNSPPASSQTRTSKKW
jgi:transcriptional regulator with XRE-family HTH domain